MPSESAPPAVNVVAPACPGGFHVSRLILAYPA